MIARIVLIQLALVAGSYALLHLLTRTGYFKDPARVKRIVIRTLLSIGAAVLAISIFSAIFFVDHVI
jgi:hypothetical protein